QASKCSHYYSPFIVGNLEGKPAPLFTELRPGLFEVHKFAQALAVRAMLHAGEGRHDDAWQDLLACHRLWRLMGKGATLLQALVAIAFGEIAMRGELALLDSPKVDRRQLSRWLGELQKLPPMTPLADSIDFIERLYGLDMIFQLERRGAKVFDSAD